MDIADITRIRRQSAERAVLEAMGKVSRTPPGFAAIPNVWRCPSTGVYRWSVTLGGQVVDSGTEPTEEAARRAAAEAVPPSDVNARTSGVEPSRPDPKGLRWAYGVTTVPARMGGTESLLRRTLASLARGGFDKPRLFVDGTREYNLPAWTEHYEVTCRFPALRVHGNWVLSLYELYVREPHADRYAIFQDDLVTCVGLREYLDSCRYPERGYWNLYTVPHNQRLAPRSPQGGTIDGWYPSNQLGKGALATVFDRLAVTTLLTSEHMVLRPQDRTETIPGSGWYRGQEAVDGGIVTALRKAGWTEYVHSPSLVQHTGLETTLGLGHKVGRPAESFRGEEWDVRQLIHRGQPERL